MQLYNWGEVFTLSLQSLWLGFIQFVPALLVALILFIIGWVIASILGKAVEQLIGALKIDRIFESAGADEMFKRAGMKFSVGGFLGALVRWFIIIVFLVASLDILGLDEVKMFLREVVLGYLPQVIVAALILIVATIVADGASKLIKGSARAANVHSAEFLGTIARYAIWIFALIIALSQLGIAPQFMQILFTGIIAMLALAGGLAFGLGGKDAAARAIEHFKNEASSK